MSESERLVEKAAPRPMAEYSSPDLRRRLAEAWFAGYDKGNLDGYFGTRDERKNSPYSDLDPYNESSVCGVGGPREASSDCVRPKGHGGEHRDDSNGTWPVAETPRFTPANPSPTIDPASAPGRDVLEES